MIEWTKRNDALGTSNRGVACESGLCTLCDSSCEGKCETWMSALRGRKMLYPRNFGSITAGSSNVTAVGLGYHALRIQGYAYGAKGLPAGQSHDPDNAIFTRVDLTTTIGRQVKIKCRRPMMTGALGSTFVAGKYWDSFAVGAALCGIPIVIGENVVGIDRDAVITKGRIKVAPELDRRIQKYLDYYDGHGAIIVQMNVEDTRNGVAEYVIGKYGDQVMIELKWGQGAKCIGGEIQVSSLEYAKFLKDRGYLVDPDPYDAAAQLAFKEGGIQSFARHSRLGATDIDSAEQLLKAFAAAVKHLRKLGYQRISLKTGSYGMEALALALRVSSDHDLDLLTIDGSGGGTGMSPWNMMEHWGVPPLPLHARAWQYAEVLKAQGKRVPDLALAGGLAREDHVFKALALGAPYVKLVCMGRAPMIPGFVGSNIEGALHPDRREKLNGHWEKLPATVTQYGQKPEEIFAGWETVAAKVGKKEMAKVPFGAVAMFNYVDKVSCGLQQFMAGARKFRLSEIARDDLFAANRETAAETGIPFVADAQHERALAVLKG